MTVVSKHNECKNATWQCFCIVSYHNSHREAGDVPGFFMKLFCHQKRFSPGGGETPHSPEAGSPITAVGM